MSTKETEIVNPIISKSPQDAGTPGVQVEYTADDAEANGAFQETAMSEFDAWQSNADLVDDKSIGKTLAQENKSNIEPHFQKPKGE